MQFHRIEQQSLYTEIMQRIRYAIVSGELAFGEHLSEVTIARQMEVSRIPLREALMHLSEEGLIRRVRGRGFFVISFCAADVHEVFSLRAMLECMALTLSIPILDTEDKNQLTYLIECQQAAAESGQFDGLTQLDMQFHEYFCIKANHSRLLKTWRTYQTQVLMLINRRLRSLSEVTPQSVTEDHKQLLDAVDRKDILAAASITRSISDRVAKECVQVACDRRSEGGAKSTKKDSKPEPGLIETLDPWPNASIENSSPRSRK